jgi:hypothetical protein
MLPAFPRRAAALAAIGALLAPAAAKANGRYPAAGQIAIHPGDPSTILVRATYGLLLTRDAGQRWDWICEGAVGFTGNEDPMISFAKDGTLLAGIFEGLSVSRDACQWDFAGGGLTGHYVVDLAVDKVDPTKAVLVISNSTGTGGYLGQVWQTADSGATWAQAGTDLPAELLALTLDTAPSQPDRIYVSGRLGPPDYAGVLQRSDDRGVTWTSLPIAGADDQNLPYIGAIDPHDPDTVYVRIDGAPGDRLLVSHDGGQSWTKVFDGAGDLLGFALSPDGATVAVGGDADGLWTAPASTLSFTKRSSLGVRCLSWAPAGLYACADEFVDGFTAGVSTDGGQTFSAQMHLSALCGPLACGGSSSVGNQCTAQWPATAATIAATGCDGQDAGTGGRGGAGAGGGAGGGGSSGGCAFAPPSAGWVTSCFALASLAALGLRRRRR